jgi:hypothetical protein
MCWMVFLCIFEDTDMCPWAQRHSYLRPSLTGVAFSTGLTWPVCTFVALLIWIPATPRYQELMCCPPNCANGGLRTALIFLLLCEKSAHLGYPTCIRCSFLIE